MYRDYEAIDYYKMKIPNVGGEELLMRDISKDKYKDFNQRITSCWINIGSVFWMTNRNRSQIFESHPDISNVGWKDICFLELRIMYKIDHNLAFTDLKRIQAGFRSLGLWCVFFTYN